MKRQESLAAVALAAFALLAFGAGSASAAAPTLTVDPGPSASYVSAEVSGQLDPADNDVYYWFQYSHDPDTEEWTNGPEIFARTLAAGSGPSAVSETLTGLKGGTEYKVRLVAFRTDESEIWTSEAPYVSFTTVPVGPPSASIDPVSALTATGAHFSGHVDPEAPAGDPAAFDVHWEFRCTPECPGLQTGTVAAAEGEVQVEADATGLEPNTEYEVELVATNVGGSSAEAGPEAFTTDALAPVVETIPAFALEGGTAALVGGRINPKNSATTYWIEYGTDESYGSSFPASEDADAGAGGQDRFVSQELTGLTPGTEYHFRLVAESTAGKVEGEDMTFRTPVPPAPPSGPCSNADLRTGPSAALPDCRAYELVSPPDLGGNSVRAVNDAAATQPWSPVAADGSAVLWATDAVLPGIDSTGGVDDYLSSRTPDGWATHFVSPPGSKALTPSTPVWASPNLERIIWAVFGATIDPTDLDPVGTKQGSQLFEDLYREEPDGSFLRLTQGSQAPAVASETVSFAGTSLDGLTAVYMSDRPLEPDALSPSIYERSGETTTLVSRDENENPVAGVSSAFGVSADGSMVAFGNSSELYLRNVGLAHTIFLARDPSGATVPEGMSADGSKVFFATGAALTGDDEDTSVDLYEFDTAGETFTRLSAPTGHPAGAGPGNSDACATPLPRLENCSIAAVSVSPDESKAYFVSPERLDGSRGIEGSPNLYFAQGGETHFVATLDPGDKISGEAQGYNGFGLAARHAHRTPENSNLIFESRARLTAYDNAGHIEVYVYSPANGRLFCASCRPDGEVPIGNGYLRGGDQEASTEFVEDPLYNRNSDAEGKHFFFQSTDQILPQDVNEKPDVYEFDATTGVTSLISTGESSAESAYYGNSLDGRDVFLISTDALAPQDRSSGTFKVYDARIGGGFAEPDQPGPCEGEGCRGPSSVGPPPTSVGTTTLDGPGNPKPHRKKHHKRKKHHRKHRRHAGRHGGAGR